LKNNLLTLKTLKYSLIIKLTDSIVCPEEQSIKTSAVSTQDKRSLKKLQTQSQSIGRLEQIDFRLLAVTQSLKILTDFDNLLTLPVACGKHAANVNNQKFTVSKKSEFDASG